MLIKIIFFCIQYILINSLESILLSIKYFQLKKKVHDCNTNVFIFYQVNESFPFSIALSWKGAALGTQNGAADNQQSTVVFPRGNPIPSVKALTFYRSGTFSVDVQYADVGELQPPAKISTYTVIYITLACSF